MVNESCLIMLKAIAVVLALQCFEVETSNGHSRTRRFVNGSEAVPHPSPWMGYLCRADRTSCGASLISRNMGPNSFQEEHSSDIVLTAAHCFLVNETLLDFVDPSSTKIRVVFGKHFKYEEGRADFSVDVVKAFIHPNYTYNFHDKTNQKNDIAILQLKHSVAYDEYTEPIALQSMHQDSYEDCYLAGWSVTEPKWKSEALNVIRFKEITFNNTVQYFQAATSNQFPYDGDSGGPLVCQQENQPVAVGVFWGSNERLSFFTCIHHHLKWIQASIDEMEQASAAYRSNLMDHVQTLSHDEDEWSLTEDYLKVLYESFPNTMPFELSGQPENRTDIDSSMIDKVHKYLEVQKGFCLSDIKSTFLVANAEKCAALCYRENRHGSCNYFPVNNGCYLMRTKKQPTVMFDTEMSVCLQFTDAEEREQLNLLFEQQHHHLPPKNRSQKWFAQYEVAIHGNKWLDYQCDAQLQSHGEFYTTMSVSSRCLQKIWSKTSYITSFGLISIVDDHATYVQIKPDNIVWDSTTARTQLEEPIRRQEQAPLSVGHDIDKTMSEPSRRMYWPLNGAFIAEPFSMPWIVRFYEHGPGTADKYICMGVLVNQTGFVPDAFKDETILVLASTACLATHRMRRFENIYGVIGSHPHCIGKFSTIEAIPIGVLSGQKWPVKDFVLVQLRESIKFNEYVKPIQWPSANFSIYSNYFIASRSPENIWTDDFMTEIPIALDSGVDGELNVRKIYKKNGNLNDINNSDPIIACQTSSDTECAILGFSWGKGIYGSYEQEHISIYPRLDWINSMLSDKRSLIILL